MSQGTSTRLETIVETTVALLDEEGLSGLNMRSLGARMNAAATTIYWHVKGKDDLVLLAGAQVWEEIALPDLASTSWREAGMTLARELLSMLSRHPWLVQSMGSHLTHGRGKARFDDHSLAVYELAGFPPADADEAVSVVFVFVLGSALGAAASQELRRRLGSQRKDADKEIAAAIAEQAAVAQEFPRLAARVASAAGSDVYATPGDSFEFGLAAIFDGLERRLEDSRSTPAPRSEQVNGWFA